MWREETETKIRTKYAVRQYIYLNLEHGRNPVYDDCLNKTDRNEMKLRTNKVKKYSIFRHFFYYKPECIYTNWNRHRMN